MELRKFLLILTLTVIVLLLTIIWFYPSDEDFRTTNRSWNGISEINSHYQITPIESLSLLPSSPQGSTLVLIPYLTPMPSELDMLENFVARGGTLILADDYGYGNEILEHLGLQVRFSGKSLLDPLSHYKNKWFPRISHLNPGPLTRNIKSLVLNHATAIINSERDDIIALSSSFSFLDQNGNQIWDEAEPTGPFTVISLDHLGNGQVILIADPSIFINSMEPIEDNQILLNNIASATTSRLFIDQSHLSPSTLYQTKSLLIHVHDFFTQPLGIIGIITVVLAITLKPIWQKTKTKLS